MDPFDIAVDNACVALFAASLIPPILIFIARFASPAHIAGLAGVVLFYGLLLF